jgi:ARG/rhodanese/phosphatase superfamily protein
MNKLWISIGILLTLIGLALVVPCLKAGGTKAAGGYQVLAPIRNGNLTIFPVVADTSHDTSQFLTLDEGLRSGDVVVTEAGNAGPLVRPRPGHPVWDVHPRGGAQVNQLVLINNSKRPLLLLAGEIVTGGKQDRIIGKDRLVPAESDPRGS